MMDKIEDAAGCLLGQSVAALEGIGELWATDPNHRGEILLANPKSGHEGPELGDDRGVVKDEASVHCVGLSTTISMPSGTSAMSSNSELQASFPLLSAAILSEGRKSCAIGISSTHRCQHQATAVARGRRR